MSTARSWLLKYFEAARISFRNRSKYIVNLLARTVTVGIRIGIFYQLYSLTYRSSGLSEVHGLNLTELMWILALTQSFQTSTRPPPVNSFIEEEIKSGEFAYTVCRPYSYILYHLSTYIGRTLPNLAFNLVVTGTIVSCVVGLTPVSLESLAFGGLLLTLGLLLDFVMTFSIGLVALWTEEANAFYFIYQKTQLVLGGQVLPLAMFPDKLRDVAELTPFALLYYGASKIIIDFKWTTFLLYLSYQMIWIVFFTAIALAIFNFGVKRVSINGG